MRRITKRLEGAAVEDEGDQPFPAVWVGPDSRPDQRFGNTAPLPSALDARR